jgi:hypothetical protein
VSDPGPDRAPRQAPRWGEYATPEEVAALRGPDAAPPAPVPVPIAEAPPPTGAPRPGPPPAGHAPAWDRPITVGLLVFGLIQVVSSIPLFLDFADSLSTWLTAYTGGSAAVPSSADAGGVVLLVLDVVLYAGALLLSLERMRRGRRAFWVPLVAGIAATIAQTVVILVVTAPVLAVAVQNQG